MAAPDKNLIARAEELFDLVCRGSPVVGRPYRLWVDQTQQYFIALAAANPAK